MLKEFKEFAMKGNVIDMAVGIIIGAAFSAVVASLVADVLMPPIGLVLGNVDFSNIFVVIRNGTVPPPYHTVAAAKAAGAVTINIGVFINTVINLIIVALALFILVKSINRLKRASVPAPAAVTKECPFCCSTVNKKATRCPYCTSDLK
ncbi:MAG: large conductance mechanosensitive channel protein MscL [Planctomycetota bacterium]|nr:large conductance mechanosensitive channel protein MscL [Planctomycetota bacterium]